MAPTSRERVLAAATIEFAARGYDGATVDRIAAGSGLNKAMVYYHFTGKAALYRAILRDVFAAVADAVEPLAGVAAEAGDRASVGATADARLRRYIETLAGRAMASQEFRGLWLREMADGGRHLDASVVAELGRVLETLGRILADGVAEGRFRRAHPLITHLGIVAPLLVFAATDAARHRFAGALPPAGAQLDWAEAVRQVQDATLAALRPAAARVAPRDASGGTGRSRRKRRSAR